MKRILILFFTLICAGALSAQTLADADAAFKSGRFNEAQKTYEQLSSSDDKNTAYTAQLKTVDCMLAGFKYDTAAQKIYSYALPEDGIWRARFLLYRTFTAGQMLNNYGFAMDTDEMDTPEAVPVYVSTSQGTNTQEKAAAELTKKQWQQKQDDDFTALWALREKLINAPIADETLLINTKDTDTERIPTLFDFTVVKLRDFILSKQQKEDIFFRAFDFTGPVYSSKNAGVWNLEKLAEIYEEAYNLKGTGRDSARGFWRVERVMLPFNFEDQFEPADKKEAAKQAAALLSQWAGYGVKKEEKKEEVKESFFSKLFKKEPAKESVKEEDFTPYAKSFAAFNAANLLNDSLAEYESAVNTALYCEGLTDKNFSKLCGRTIKDIRREVVDSGNFPAAPNPNNITLNARLRNVNTLYGRVYKTSVEELKSMQRYSRDGYSYLTYFNANAENLKKVLAETPVQTFSQNFTYEKKYGFLDKAEIKVPPVNERGLYIVLLSSNQNFDFNAAPVYGAPLNITDIMLAVSTGIEDNPDKYVYDFQNPSRVFTPDIFKFFVLNPKTGAPVQGAKIDTYVYEEPDRTFTSDKDGTAAFNHNVAVSRNNSNYINISPLAAYQNSYAYLQNMPSFSYSTPEPIVVFVETDRAIYRPGQDAQIKVTALERVPRGFKVYSRPYPVKIEIRNANYKTVAAETIKLNDFGSAAYKFTVPQTGLLGNYSINATVQDAVWTGSGYANFKVEEYKRPEFEVTLKDADAPWYYGADVKVEGGAKYYYGGGAANANVEYKVYREDYIPYFFWWLSWYRGAGREEVAYGKTTANSDGDFNFTFKPESGDNAKKNNLPSTYTVEVNVFDAGGRTINATKTYRASKDPVMFKIDLPTGFADAGKYYKLDVSLVDINDKPQSGSAAFELYSLENNYDKDAATLEQAFEKTKEITEVYSVTVNFNKDKPSSVTIPAQKEGVYRIKLKQKDGNAEQNALLIFASENSTLDLPSVTIPEHSAYYPGETARILLGAGGVQNTKYVQVKQDNFVLRYDTIRQSGASIYSFPVTQEHRGGVTVNWFGVSDYKTYSGGTSVSIPHNDKELTVEIKTPSSVLPGEKVNWTFGVSDYQKRPVNAEATVKIYDRSLDYYSKPVNPLAVGALYGGSRYAYYGQGIENSLFDVNFNQFFKNSEKYEYISETPLPHFNAEYSYRYFGMGRGLRSAMYAEADMVMEARSAPNAAGAAPMMNKAATLSAAGDMKQEAAADKSAQMEAAAGGVEARTDMSETAYFAPQSKVINGKGSIALTMPQRLTSWNIIINAITKDALLGTTTIQTATKKDLMIRLEIPRFLREGDKAQLKGIISNETDRDMTVNSVLLVKENGKNAYDILNFTDTRATTLVKAKSQATVTWDAKVESGVRVLTLSAIARAGQLSDGEVKEIPILPSRERLVDSKVAALKEGSNIIEIADLKKPDDTRIFDVMQLQIDVNLILPVFNSLPMLVEYPFENLFSLTSKYVPLAIVNNFYQKYPELRKAVAQLPKRDTVTPPWQADNPVRQTVLSETPWLYEAEGRKVDYGKIVDMFDAKNVAELAKKTEDRLACYQNSDGGFGWFCGGKSDTYVTLYLLENFALAASQDVKVPQDLTKRAMRYVTGKVDDIIKDTKNTGENQIVMSLYAAYVLTSFPPEWKETQDALKKSADWLEYAAKYERFMTPLGKIYAANVYYRLGNKTESDRYLDAVLDMMTVDDTAGAYFTPEAKSWLWYSDTLEKHAITLRTLLKLRPTDKRIDDMVKWMLFNRKGNTWTSTKAAASAIYALLDVMKARGAFTTDTTYKITWGDVKDEQTFKPFDFVKKPLQYVKEGSKITLDDISAQVVKSGKTTDFASLSAVYSTDGKVDESSKGLMNVSRQYFLRYKDGDVYKLKLLNDGDTVNVGDEIEIQLTINTSSQFEYVMLKDQRPAGFEAENLLSGWKWDLLSRYEEPRDSLTNFFIDWLPQGTYTLKYRIRPTTAGTYKIGAAQLQSMYAPEFAAHSANMTLSVK
ncbi:MAG: MG2 domain-containing protein [Elusimicrobia bacterium]|nr:MG2 domain-containing protein [Elusimicrobiota bacterium]